MSPAPDLRLVPAADAALPLAAGGAPWQIDATVLTGMPSGQDLYAQALFLDPAVPGGLTPSTRGCPEGPAVLNDRMPALRGATHPSPGTRTTTGTA